MASPHPLSWADAPPFYYHGTTPQPAPDSSSDGAGPRSLWIGGLLHWMDEDYLYACFTTSPEVRPAPRLAVCSIIISLVLGFFMSLRQYTTSTLTQAPGLWPNRLKATGLIDLFVYLMAVAFLMGVVHCTHIFIYAQFQSSFVPTM